MIMEWNELRIKSDCMTRLGKSCSQVCSPAATSTLGSKNNFLLTAE